MIRRFVRDEPVDATRALVDDIAAVGVGGHYLGRRSTRELYRGGEQWQPALLRREPFDTYAGRTLVGDAAERARQILAEHDVTPLADDVAAQIDRVIEAHAKRVGAPGSRVSWREDG
jgi:trimethylamine:corrinoid methyltransferase-like protein